MKTHKTEQLDTLDIKRGNMKYIKTRRGNKERKQGEERRANDYEDEKKGRKGNKER